MRLIVNSCPPLVSPNMNEPNLSDGEAGAIDDRMAAQMELRRSERPDRRQEGRDRRAKPPSSERRKICRYCFQRGDHPTVSHCLRALERPDRVIPASPSVGPTLARRSS